jgi:hypothetical protein
MIFTDSRGNAPGFFAAPRRRLPFSLRASPEGMERHEAQPFSLTPCGVASVCARTPASQRSIGGICRGSAPDGGPAISPGPRFLNRLLDRPIQRAPRRASVVRPGRGPGPPECEVTSLARRGRTSLRQPSVPSRRPQLSEVTRIIRLSGPAGISAFCSAKCTKRTGGGPLKPGCRTHSAARSAARTRWSPSRSGRPSPAPPRCPAAPRRARRPRRNRRSRRRR